MHTIFTLPTKTKVPGLGLLLALITLLAPGWLFAQTVVFTQDFTGSTTVANYFNTGGPTANQFTNINRDGSNNWTINAVAGNNQLRQNRSGNTPYIVRTQDWTPDLKFVRFKMKLFQITNVTQNDALRLYLGSGLGDNNSEEAAWGRIRINTENDGQCSVRRLDGGGSTSASFNVGTTGVVLTWYLNNSCSSMAYTGPNGSANTLNNDCMDIWAGNTKLFSNMAGWNPDQSITDFKMRFLGGSQHLAFDDFEIAEMLSGAFDVTDSQYSSPYCITDVAGSANFNVAYTSSGYTFTAGNTFTAQLSDASGSFASPVNIGTLNSTAASGSITCAIPANTPSGNGYRIRVVSSTPCITSTDNGMNITVILSSGAFTISPGGTQNLVDLGGSGPAFTATQAVSSWEYSLTPGGPYTVIPGQTSTTYNSMGAHFPLGKGVYYLIARNYCTGAVSNEARIFVHCATGTNLVTNGTFASGNTGFTSQYTYVLPDGAAPSGSGSTMFPEGTYGVGLNPRRYHSAFCDFVGTPDANLSGNMLVGNVRRCNRNA